MTCIVCFTDIVVDNCAICRNHIMDLCKLIIDTVRACVGRGVCIWEIHGSTSKVNSPVCTIIWSRFPKRAYCHEVVLV